MFDRLYVVHLPNSTRRAAMTAQLAALGLEATFVGAKRPTGVGYPNFRRNPAAEFGCSLSHIKALVRALDDGAQHPLIIEDDVEFARGAMDRLRQAAQELPDDWDILYLGGHPRSDVRRHSANLVRVGTWSFAEAYLLPRRMLRPCIDHWLNRIGQPAAMYDIVLGEFAAAHNGFCVHPTITQQVGVTQIGNADNDRKAPLVQRAWQKHLVA